MEIPYQVPGRRSEISTRDRLAQGYVAGLGFRDLHLGQKSDLSRPREGKLAARPKQDRVSPQCQANSGMVTAG